MTGPRMPHPEFDELISASLTGELSDAERRRLDAHLDACDACRGTLAAFADGRRIVAGLRHVPAPRDLHARVRAGIERGRFADVPWWRRPAVLFAGIGGSLAAVAGALLAIVLLNQPSGPVGDASPTPIPTPTAVASITPSPSATFPSGPTAPPSSPTPGASPTEPAPTATPAPTVTPSPEPDAYLAVTGPGDNRALIVQDGATGQTIHELDTPSGEPIAAELSPDGQWIAYLTPVGEKGTHEVRVSRIGEAIASDDPDAPGPIDSPVPVGDTLVLGESLSGDPFVEHLDWSPDGRYLAFSVTHLETADVDAWAFDVSTAEASPLTDVGNAYAASWVPGEHGGGMLLWLSVAGDEPRSYLRLFHEDEGELAATDPADGPFPATDGVFMPHVSPNGRFAIYWNGVMEQGGAGWQFTQAGAPRLAEHVQDENGPGFVFEDDRELFSDLSIGRDGFASASITWGEDGIAYAVWDARWTGSPQSGDGDDPYPDPTRVYFSQATDPRGLTRVHAIDRGDVPEDWNVVDVKVSPTGEHLVITAARPRAGALDPGTAELLLVERNTGDEADVVTPLAAEDGFWFGPGVFDRRNGEADRP